VARTPARSHRNVFRTPQCRHILPRIGCSLRSCIPCCDLPKRIAGFRRRNPWHEIPGPHTTAGRRPCIARGNQSPRRRLAGRQTRALRRAIRTLSRRRRNLPGAGTLRCTTSEAPLHSCSLPGARHTPSAQGLEVPRQRCPPNRRRRPCA